MPASMPARAGSARLSPRPAARCRRRTQPRCSIAATMPAPRKARSVPGSRASSSPDALMSPPASPTSPGSAARCWSRPGRNRRSISAPCSSPTTTRSGGAAPMFSRLSPDFAKNGIPPRPFPPALWGSAAEATGTGDKPRQGRLRMDIGYDRPLYILPFDHRASFEKGLFGFNAPLSPEQTKTVADSKKVVYDGLKAALNRGVPREAAGILVDEQFGADILRDARAQGYITAAPVEKSGQNEFNFEYGDKWREHLAEFKPTFAKALVRYNPEDDEAMNRRQAQRLKDLGDYVHSQGQKFMFELLVPMTKDQHDRLEGDQHLFDHDLRPSLMIAAIKELQGYGVEPDVWKIEGLDRREDAAAVAAAARRDGRDKVGCILLGRGSNEAGIIHWLKAAAPLPAYIG